MEMCNPSLFLLFQTSPVGWIKYKIINAVTFKDSNLVSSDEGTAHYFQYVHLLNLFTCRTKYGKEDEEDLPHKTYRHPLVERYQKLQAVICFVPC